MMLTTEKYPAINIPEQTTKFSYMSLSIGSFLVTINIQCKPKPKKAWRKWK